MVSIVMPVYNAEKYLKKSIESVLQQTYVSWELILIDNGSSDKSLRICREYAEREDQITVLHQYRNLGVSSARNLGMEKVRGNYVTFLDADDWIAPDYLEQLMKIENKQQADMLVCRYQKVYDADRDGAKEKTEEQVYETREYEKKEYITKCLLEGYTHCWGVLYRVSALEGIRFPLKMTIGEDVLFLIEAVLQAKKLLVTDYDGYRYYINEKGAMNRSFVSSYMDQIYCWEKARERLVEEYPETEDKLNSILLVSAVLVAGKLAVLPLEEQKAFTKEMECCQNTIQTLGSQRNVVRLLPHGYSLKVGIFRASPILYLKLYGAWKRRK